MQPNATVIWDPLVNGTGLVELQGNLSSRSGAFPTVRISLDSSSAPSSPSPTSQPVVVVVGVTNATGSVPSLPTELLRQTTPRPLAFLVGIVDTTAVNETYTAQSPLVNASFHMEGGHIVILQGGASLLLDSSVGLGSGTNVSAFSTDIDVIEPEEPVAPWVGVIPLYPCGGTSTTNSSSGKNNVTKNVTASSAEEIIQHVFDCPINVYFFTAALVWTDAIVTAMSNDSRVQTTTSSCSVTLSQCTVRLGVNASRAKTPPSSWRNSPGDTATSPGGIQRAMVAVVFVIADINGTSIIISFVGRAAATAAMGSQHRYLSHPSPRPCALTVQLWGAFLRCSTAAYGPLRIVLQDVTNVSLAHAFASLCTARRIDGVSVLVEGSALVDVQGGALVSVSSGAVDGLKIACIAVARVRIGVDSFSDGVLAAWLLVERSPVNGNKARSVYFNCGEVWMISEGGGAEACSVAVGTAGGGSIVGGTANMAGTDVQFENVSLSYDDTGPFPSIPSDGGLATQDVFGLFAYGDVAPSSSSLLSVTSFTVNGPNAWFSIGTKPPDPPAQQQRQLSIFSVRGGGYVRHVSVTLSDGARMDVSSSGPVQVLRSSFTAPSVVDYNWTMRNGCTVTFASDYFTFMQGDFGLGALDRFSWVVAENTTVSFGPGRVRASSSILHAGAILNSKLVVASGSLLSINGETQLWFPDPRIANTSVVVLTRRDEALALPPTVSELWYPPPRLVLSNLAKVLYTNVEATGGGGGGGRQQPPDVLFLCDMAPPPHYGERHTTMRQEMPPVVVQLNTTATMIMLYGAPDVISLVFTNGCSLAVHDSARLLSAYTIATLHVSFTNHSVLFGGSTTFVMESLANIVASLVIIVDHSNVTLVGSTSLLSLNRPGASQRTNEVVLSVSGTSTLTFNSSSTSLTSRPPCGLIVGWNSNLTNVSLSMEGSRVLIVTSGPRVWLVSAANQAFPSDRFQLGWIFNLSVSVTGGVVWNGTACRSNRLVSAGSASSRNTRVNVQNLTLLLGAGNLSSWTPPTSALADAPCCCWLTFGLVPLASSVVLELALSNIETLSPPASMDECSSSAGLVLLSTLRAVWMENNATVSKSMLPLRSPADVSLAANNFFGFRSPLVQVEVFASSTGRYTDAYLASSAVATSDPPPVLLTGNEVKRPLRINITSCESNMKASDGDRGRETPTWLPLRTKSDLVHPGPVLYWLTSLEVNPESSSAATSEGQCTVLFTETGTATHTRSFWNGSSASESNGGLTRTVEQPVFVPPPVITTPLQPAAQAATSTTVVSSMVVSSVIPRPAAVAALMQISSSALLCAATASNTRRANEAAAALRSQNEPATVFFDPSGEDPLLALAVDDPFCSGVSENLLQLRVPLGIQRRAGNSSLSASNSDFTVLRWHSGAEQAAGTIVGNVFIVWPLYIAVLLLVTNYRCRHHEALNPSMSARRTTRGGRANERQSVSPPRREETLVARAQRQKSIVYAVIPARFRETAAKVQYVALQSHFPGAFAVPYALLLQPTTVASVGLIGRCGEWGALPGGACALGFVGLVCCIAPYMLMAYLVVGVCGKPRWGARWRSTAPFRAVPIGAQNEEGPAAAPAPAESPNSSKPTNGNKPQPSGSLISRRLVLAAGRLVSHLSAPTYRWVQVDSSDDDEGEEEEQSSSKRRSVSQPADCAAPALPVGVAEEDNVWAPSVPRMSFLGRVSLVEPYLPGRQWFLCVELGAVLASSIPIGAAWAAGGDDCNASLWIVFVIACGSLIAVAVLRPYATMLESMWAVLMGALGVLVTLCLVLGDTDAADGIALAQAVSGLIPVLRWIPTVGAALVSGAIEAHGALRQKQRRWAVQAQRQQLRERQRQQSEDFRSLSNDDASQVVINIAPEQPQRPQIKTNSKHNSEGQRSQDHRLVTPPRRKKTTEQQQKHDSRSPRRFASSPSPDRQAGAPHQRSTVDSTSSKKSISEQKQQTAHRRRPPTVAETSGDGRPTVTPIPPSKEGSPSPPCYASRGSATTPITDEAVRRILEDVDLIKQRRRSKQPAVDSTEFLRGEGEDADRCDAACDPSVGVAVPCASNVRDLSAVASLGGRPALQGGYDGVRATTIPQRAQKQQTLPSDQAQVEIEYHTIMHRILEEHSSRRKAQVRERGGAEQPSSYQQRQNLRLLLELIVITQTRQTYFQ